jgi:hypothetical protein
MLIEPVAFAADTAVSDSRPAMAQGLEAEAEGDVEAVAEIVPVLDGVNEAEGDTDREAVLVPEAVLLAEAEAEREAVAVEEAVLDPDEVTVDETEPDNVAVEVLDGVLLRVGLTEAVEEWLGVTDGVLAADAEPEGHAPPPGPSKGHAAVYR